MSKRKLKNRMLIGLACLFLCSGCGMSEDFGQSMDAMNDARAELSLQYDLDAHIGFRVANGSLSTVTVSLQEEDVQGLATDELVNRIRPAIVKAFRDEPAVLNVVIVVRREAQRSADLGDSLNFR